MIDVVTAVVTLIACAAYTAAEMWVIAKVYQLIKRWA